jgi:hypothetical protein
VYAVYVTRMLINMFACCGSAVLEASVSDPDWVQIWIGSRSKQANMKPQIKIPVPSFLTRPEISCLGTFK